MKCGLVGDVPSAPGFHGHFVILELDEALVAI